MGSRKDSDRNLSHINVCHNLRLQGQFEVIPHHGDTAETNQYN